MFDDKEPIVPNPAIFLYATINHTDWLISTVEFLIEFLVCTISLTAFDH